MAATLVREGFKGAAEALEGRHGFLHAYAPNPNPERAVQDLGTVFELMHTAVKPYPSCRYGHAGIDAALALRAANDIKPAEITAITLGLPRAGMMLIGDAAGEEGQPAERGRWPVQRPVRDLRRAGDRRDGLGQLRPAAAMPTVRALLPKVTCEFDPEIEAEFPANMSGKLTIAARGQSFAQKVVVPKGEPTNFLTEAELRAKFAGLTDAVLGAERAGAPGRRGAGDRYHDGCRQPDAPCVTADAGAAGRGVGRPFGALV